MVASPPPLTESELLARARDLAGSTLAEVALGLNRSVPGDLVHAKGWVGQTLELALGATAGSRDQPDFEQLGVELKTVPVGTGGRPSESTFVCTIPLLDVARSEWRESRVHRKLARVLWVPIQADPERPIAERLVGEPLLWSPSPEQDAALKFDWDTLAGLIGSGQIERVTGHLGAVLQVRPKGRNAADRRWGLDEDGVRVLQLPRGFYLRARFTEGILREHYLLPGDTAEPTRLRGRSRR